MNKDTVSISFSVYSLLILPFGRLVLLAAVLKETERDMLEIKNLLMFCIASFDREWDHLMIRDLKLIKTAVRNLRFLFDL
jgi:hypothetical protein